MYKLVLICLLAIFVEAKQLTLKNAQIDAHTEVFGDSTINPQTKKVRVLAKKEQSLESIKGYFEIDALSLVSDNKDRDKHMYEVLNVENSPTISYTIKSISKEEQGYKIDGFLSMNHIQKNLSTQADISQEGEDIKMQGNFSIKLTDFNLVPPTMFFLTVRDQIDIKYNFVLKE